MQNHFDTPGDITAMAKALFVEERAINRLDGWFGIKEIRRSCAEQTAGMDIEEAAAFELKQIARQLPLSISKNAVFAGTQRDAFARSYALINPAFQVETFNGYCDPTAVYNDIEPNAEFTSERISAVREWDKQSAYVKALRAAYDAAAKDTEEAVYFVEQVTGHVIPDVRPILAHGLTDIIDGAKKRSQAEPDAERAGNYRAMASALEAALILAERYAQMALEQAAHETDARRAQLERMAAALKKVPARGADNLYEAIQSFIILWMTMCLEQAPNPYALSVGNADRIFDPYLMGLSREDSAALFKHLLVFFNVGDRSWAISQNLMIGGRDTMGSDLSCPASYALIDAYYDMNLPQPILSVKLHRNTPDELYRELGRFWFTPGCLTPSLFNDDVLFEVLGAHGVDTEDLPDYSVAGCQEPLIMGKDNGNTTNSWLNLGKILELTLHNGVSAITGKQILPSEDACDGLTILREIRKRFYENARMAVARMAQAANDASKAVGFLRVPFLSTLMGGVETGCDMRDTERQGTKYNGSGCLIHGLSVVSDSFIAVDRLLKERPEDVQRFFDALKTDFEQDEELRQYLSACPKYGNNIPEADDEAAELANIIADMVAQERNYLNNPFRPDFSTPSTHLLYGYWVGATPDGRKARQMLNYGVDPFAGDANGGLGMRTLSSFKLPYGKMPAGYASHFGIDPKYFQGADFEEKGLEFKNKVVEPLFFNALNPNLSPFYLYVNVTTADMLRKVLSDPEVYAPSGVYIMRIHGTFVNFLDLSPAIQNDIIVRLDARSTAIAR